MDMKKSLLIMLTLSLLAGCNLSANEEPKVVEEGEMNTDSQDVINTSEDEIIDEYSTFENEDFKFSFSYPSNASITSDLEAVEGMEDVRSMIITLENGNELVVSAHSPEVGLPNNGIFDVEDINVDNFTLLRTNGYTTMDGEPARLYVYQSNMNEDYFEGSIEFVLIGEDPNFDELEQILQSLEYTG